ncbi:MAG TPA: hypothetical protein VHL11_00130 [Phototrophicaceae bacterium]|nr:hypothetical protein [Phototrophicaceae bacterium]
MTNFVEQMPCAGLPIWLQLIADNAKAETRPDNPGMTGSSAWTSAEGASSELAPAPTLLVTPVLPMI